MATKTLGKQQLLTLICSALLICALAAISSRPARADSGDLPPRPTAKAVVSSSASGFIRLDVAFPATWSWTTQPWQTIHTQVQWQTSGDDWINVNGWHGALDDVAISSDASVTGTKIWWVAPRDYGAGPFRWLAISGDTAVPLAASTPFTLPVHSARTTDVAISLPE